MNLTRAPYKLSFLQLFQWARRPADFLDACTRLYGDIFTVQFPSGKPITFVSHPKALENVFTAHLETFDFKEGNQLLRPLVRDHSLMLMNGRPHQRERKLMMPPFHGERMRLYGRVMCDLTQQMMKSWEVGNVLNIHSCMDEITLNSIFHIIFGLADRESSEQLRQKLHALIEIVTSPFFALCLLFPPLQRDLGPWSPWGRFLLLQKRVDQLLYAEIAQRHQRPQPERTDILSLLMAARDEEGQPMSDEELRDELMTLLIAGHDTTSTAMMWALYWIHKVPRVRERLLAELDTISDPLDTKAIAQLPYLTATCQETLRLRPGLVVGFLRVTNTPFEMMGYEFPVGSWIWPNIYSAHRRQEVYPDPEQFQPERFLKRQFSPYEYLPFGGGTRLCIGQAFGQFQMKLVLFTILTRYQLALTDSRPIHSIRRGPGLEPSRTIRMSVSAHHRRSNVASQSKEPIPSSG
jgi:cytochrome P450